MSVLVTRAAGVGRAAAAQTGETHSDRCRPTLCALGTEPHAHCVCGLPMPVGAPVCSLCRSEALVLDDVVTDDHEIAWDGQRYPSLRLNRPSDTPAAWYHDLLQTILAPGVHERRRVSTEEAA